MLTLADAQKAYLAFLDVNYSYRFAKQMEQFKSNSVLGYRTAGSRAEFETGELLFHEMKRIGLTDVCKDAFTLDTWEFDHARLSFKDADGSVRRFELGGYQTNFHTGGPKKFAVVSAGKGTAEELSGLNVEGKLVLIDINQRDDWWISYPVYQAHLHGAAAVIAVQNNGYGEIDSTALNAQNIAGPADAPAFSLSQADAHLLRNYIASCGGEAAVFFDACSTVGFDGTSYNIVGKIPGRSPDSMLLVSAHYDSYFSGFQDDNAAVALMLGIARSILASGYRPEKTLVFCAMAAEEWGVSNSKYDWSTGAYNEIFRVHPEWIGKVAANINFELPAYAHDTQDVIRCVYEYSTFLNAFVSKVPDITHLYPDGLSIVSPVMTWSDDFSMAIAGVPSMVNDFAEGSYMETHYHTQFDNDDAYDESIYRFHHALYGTLLLAYDRCAVPPLDFVPRLAALKDRIDIERMTQCGANAGGLILSVNQALTAAELLYQQVCMLNYHYANALDSGDRFAADALYAKSRTLSAGLLSAFKFCEDRFTRLGWHDAVLFPHEYAQLNLALLDGALRALNAGDVNGALDHWLHQIDTTWYAYYFDEAVCRHFTDYVLHQPADRLMWGAGRICGLVDLVDVVKSLLGKRGGMQNLKSEIFILQNAEKELSQQLIESVSKEIEALDFLSAQLQELLKS